MQLFRLHRCFIFEDDFTFLTTVQPESFHQHLGVVLFTLADSTSRGFACPMEQTEACCKQVINHYLQWLCAPLP